MSSLSYIKSCICTTSTEMKISVVRVPANGRGLQRTGSTSDPALWDSAASLQAHTTETVLYASLAVTSTTSSQGAVRGTLASTASGRLEVTGAFVSSVGLPLSVRIREDIKREDIRNFNFSKQQTKLKCYLYRLDLLDFCIFRLFMSDLTVRNSYC